MSPLARERYGVEQVESGSEFTYLFPFVFIEVLCNVPLHYPDVSVSLFGAFMFERF